MSDCINNTTDNAGNQCPLCKKEMLFDEKISATYCPEMINGEIKNLSTNSHYKKFKAYDFIRKSPYIIYVNADTPYTTIYSCKDDNMSIANSEFVISVNETLTCQQAIQKAEVIQAFK